MVMIAPSIQTVSVIAHYSLLIKPCCESNRASSFICLITDNAVPILPVCGGVWQSFSMRVAEGHLLSLRRDACASVVVRP